VFARGLGGKRFRSFGISLCVQSPEPVKVMVGKLMASFVEEKKQFATLCRKKVTEKSVKWNAYWPSTLGGGVTFSKLYELKNCSWAEFFAFSFVSYRILSRGPDLVVHQVQRSLFLWSARPPKRRMRE
jgi:hypothetical protein